jgi:hypothetical protein
MTYTAAQTWPLLISSTVMVVLYEFEHDLRVHHGSFMVSGIAMIPLIAAIAYLRPRHFIPLAGLLILLNVAEVINHPDLLQKGAGVRITSRILIASIGYWITTIRHNTQQRERALTKGIQAINLKKTADRHLNALTASLAAPLKEMEGIAQSIGQDASRAPPEELTRLLMLSEALAEPLQTLNQLHQQHDQAYAHFNLVRTIEENLATLQPALRSAGLNVEILGPETRAHVWGCEALISRAIHNLLLDTIEGIDQAESSEPLRIRIEHNHPNSSLILPIPAQAVSPNNRLRQLSTDAILASQNAMIVKTLSNQSQQGTLKLELTAVANHP